MSIAIAASVCACSGSGGGATAPRTGGPGDSANQAPTIAGDPDRSARQYDFYEFLPASHDADGDRLKFEINNKPPWAHFDHSSGRLYGTPDAADVGIYEQIRIRVTDGHETVAMAGFSIEVTEAGEGSATLSWYPPAENADGSILTDLAGYRIYYGKNAGKLIYRIDLDNPGLTRYVVEGLPPARWHFVMTALNSKGIESRRSKAVSKRIA